MSTTTLPEPVPQRPANGGHCPTPSPVLRVDYAGREAFVRIDTGHRLKSGRSWQATLSLPCPNSFTARLVATDIERRLGDAIAQARRDAYRAGYRDARARRDPRASFSRAL